MPKGTSFKDKAKGGQFRKHLRFALRSRFVFQVLKPNHTENQSKKNNASHTGLMLNFSQGGLLVLTSCHLTSGDFLALNLEAPGLAPVRNVIGKVKRVEKEGRECLAGVEFCAVEEFYASTFLSEGKGFPKDLGSFSEKIEEIILRKKLTLIG